jgi:choline-sulfatase
MTASSKPNILIIMSDEHAAWASSPYGHRIVQTPNIERLAKKGVTFDGAYCNAPICGPSRMAYMTGLLPSRIDAWDNGKPLPSDIPTWAHYLAEAGYQTAISGKMHFIGPDQNHGFECRITPERINTRIAPCVSYIYPNPQDTSNFLEAGIGKNRGVDSDRESARRAASFLEGGEGRDPSRPFALCASFFVPHFPLLADKAFFDLYWPDGADVPEIPAGYMDNMHPTWQALREFYQCDKMDAERTRKARAAYYGLCTFMDSLVGEVLDALERSGQADNTIVIYHSDHGEHVGGHGLYWKRSFFEESVRVPLIMSWPGRFPQGARRPEAVSLIDLAATYLDWAGTTPVGKLDGRSLAKLVKGEDPDWPDTVISEYYGTDEAFGEPHNWLARQPRRMIRKGRYKLNYFVGARQELYDLKNDPGEWNDLAGHEEHSDIVTALTDEVTRDWHGEELFRRMELSRLSRKLILDATLRQAKAG